MPIVKTALTVKDLPPPPPDKTGWPWTEQTEPLPELMPDGSSEWPLISIVTPSYNQGDFIEETIRSVLLQGYPNLEYIIIDGGSTDNSIEIIQKYKPFLAYWISEPGGTPVICTGAGAMHEFVDDGRTGFVVKQNSGEAIAAALNSLISLSRSEYAQFQANCREWIQSWSWSTVVQRHLELYRDL